MKNTTNTVDGIAHGHITYGYRFIGYIKFEMPDGKEVQVDGEFEFDQKKGVVLHTHYGEDDSKTCYVVAVVAE